MKYQKKSATFADLAIKKSTRIHYCNALHHPGMISFQQQKRAAIISQDNILYFLITLSAGRVGVSTGTVDVSAGESVLGSLVESVVGVSSLVSLPLQAVMKTATARITSNFFI